MQIERGQTPAVRIPGSGQVRFKLLLSTHKETKYPKVRVWLSLGPVIPSPDLFPLSLIPLGLARQLGYDEGRTRRARLRYLWGE